MQVTDFVLPDIHDIRSSLEGLSVSCSHAGCETVEGITITSSGFYGPQGRVLRINTLQPDLNSQLQGFEHEGARITNFEMETSAIYGLSKLLGHEACSINAILANRALGTFSKNPQETIDKLIVYTLNKLIS